MRLPPVVMVMRSDGESGDGVFLSLSSYSAFCTLQVGHG